MHGLSLNNKLAKKNKKKIYMYFIESNGTVVKTELESKSAVAKLLEVQYLVITNHLDKGGINGYYLFTHELSSLDLKKTNWILIIKKNEKLYSMSL